MDNKDLLQIHSIIWNAYDQLTKLHLPKVPNTKNKKYLHHYNLTIKYNKLKNDLYDIIDPLERIIYNEEVK